jgi:hypothetical protein
MAVRMGRDGGGTSVLAERARSEGARSTRALEVTPVHPVTSWGEEWESENRESSGRTIGAVAVLAEQRRGWSPDDLLCSRNARPEKECRKGVRSFLCSRSARPKKGLARRPQSKAPHALAWLCIEMEQEYEWARAVEDQSGPIPREKRASLEGACKSFDART